MKFLIRPAFALLVALLSVPPSAAADIEAGVNWLGQRDSGDGLHRESDLVGPAMGNTEAWFTVQRLGATSRVPSLASAASSGETTSTILAARRAMAALDQGINVSDRVDALLRLQDPSVGGFPSHSGYASDPLSTATVLALLDRVGRGGQTPAQRAITYLTSTQRADGGWAAVQGGDSQAWTTAQIAPVLLAFETRFALDVVLSRTRGYLLGRIDASGSAGSLHATALVLEALLQLRADRAALQASASLIDAAQSADGSFSNELYQTAVALRALHAWAQPPVDPQRATLRGRVIAADTSLPITGASFVLQGAANATLVSDNRGELNASNLEGGSYTARLSYPGMQALEFNLTLVAGRSLDMGDLRLFQAGGGLLSGVIRGQVNEAATGNPVPEVEVRLEPAGVSVRTDADGRYHFLQVPPGNVVISTNHPGYCASSTAALIEPRSVLELSIRLTGQAAPTEQAEVRGTILHGQTGVPLAAVRIEAESNGVVVAADTAADGSYSLVVAPSAEVRLSATRAGFDPVEIRVSLVRSEILEFSPRLYPEGETPDGANRARISGQVVNQANQQPIRNALILVTDPAGQQSLRSGDDGRFTIENLRGPTVRLAISADAFDSAQLLVALTPLEQRDVGSIGLKPTALQFYLPDLVITQSSLGTSDPDSFRLEDSFTLEVSNRGSSGVTQDFDLLAFFDVNGNGLYDEGTEPQIGRTRVEQDLPIGGSAEVAIAVSAQLGFRDAPVAFWVDAGHEIPEQDEDNNTESSEIGCRVTPAFIAGNTVTEAWRWRGVAGDMQVNSLSQTPVVGQLNDDNGDGVINQYDIPDLVFVAGLRGQHAPSRTAVVAVSGRDGSQLWTRTDIRLSHFASLALGDIDNDGVAEIVGVTGYREELIALENDGRIKWRVRLNGPGVPVPAFPPPAFVYDMPVIANLEGDNEAEIVLGREVFRGFSGEQLWEGEFDGGGHGGGTPMVVVWGLSSIAADVDLDGVMEVIAGRTLYDVDGRTRWHRGDIKPTTFFDFGGNPQQHSGYTAVGNFDLDDFAEIVLVVDDELYLLEHTGETIWGPKFAPDFNYFGAPTVVDLDNDGLPEILLASTTRLTVFETDGTVKWTREIVDTNGITTATVFDFENDGLYEVVHADQADLRILDALTGTQLYEVRNTSRTVFELPIVADVDGDKQADIIVSGFDDDLLAGVTPGVRVFRARNGAWADAGSIWGANGFHISEVREDSTLPLIEEPSWLTHNSYRVQRSPMPDPLGMPDYTLGDLRLIERGPGNRPVVQVRVGNAGPVDSHEPPWVAVYRGDPAAGGELLAETRLDTLRPGRFQVVNLGEVQITGYGDLYAVVDPAGRANECREVNNQRSIPFAAANGSGQLQLSSDRLVYAPREMARFSADVRNTGALTAGFTVELSVLDAQGRTVYNFETLSADEVAAGDVQRLGQEWSTGAVLGGDYVLRGRLRNMRGQQLASATANFRIEGAGAAPAAELDISLERAEYGPGEQVMLDLRARNASDADIIRAPEIVLELSGPGGIQVLRTYTPDDLFPGAGFNAQLQVTGAELPAAYSVQARLRSGLTGLQLAADSADFLRLADSSAQVRGAVSVARAQVNAGEPQTCLYTVGLMGTGAQLGVPIRMRLMREGEEQAVSTLQRDYDLIAGADQFETQQIATAGLPAGLYVCVLETAQASDWRLLDSKPFTLTRAAPEIRVQPAFGLVTSEAGQSASFAVSLSQPPSAEVRVPLEASDPLEWRVSLTEVVFSPSTWDQPRTVVVTGLDDSVVDGDQQGFIRLLPAISADPAFAGIDPVDVGVLNLDDDRPQVLVAPRTVETSEAGNSATFTVRLSAVPAAEVRVPLLSSDDTEWRVSTSELVFTAQNWAEPQQVTVTGQDDSEIDGDQEGLILLLPIQTADPAYAGIDPPDVLARNRDDDSASILVAPLSLVTSEDGGRGEFRVRLGARPGAAVRIVLGSIDASEWRVLATDVRLDAGNWSEGVSVTVEGVDDTEADGTVSGVLRLLPAESADPNFHGIDPADVQLQNLDNDGVQILVAPTSGLVTSEAGQHAEFTVRLTEVPIATVEINLVNPDPSEFQLDRSQLRFEPSGALQQSVRVTGVDDNEADGNINGLIQLRPAISADSRFNGIDPQDVLVTNIDDEQVQVIVTPSSLIETSESGTSDTVEIRLTQAPTHTVEIELLPPDPGEWLLDRSVVSFTPADWQQARQVVVTGVDDTEIDGDQVGRIVFLPLRSEDARYRGLLLPDVLTLNRDDDEDAPALLLIGEDLQTSEAGDTGRVRIELRGRPSAEVRIRVSSSRVEEILVEPSELVFAAGELNAFQLATLRGVDERLVDGDQSVLIEARVSSSADPRYTALPSAQVTAVNLDNDSAELQFRLTGPASFPEGGQTSLALQLRGTPQHAVSIDFRIEAPGAATNNPRLVPARLVIQPQQAGQVHALSLLTDDDALVNGARSIRVHIDAVRSADPAFNGLLADPIALQLIDNDQAPVTVPIGGKGSLAWLILVLGGIALVQLRGNKKVY